MCVSLCVCMCVFVCVRVWGSTAQLLITFRPVDAARPDHLLSTAAVMMSAISVTPTLFLACANMIGPSPRIFFASLAMMSKLAPTCRFGPPPGTPNQHTNLGCFA